MPTYSFKDIQSGVIYEEFLTLSEFDEYKEQHKDSVIPLITTPPLISSGRGMGKPDEGFRDVLKEIKKNHTHQRSFSAKSTINTF